MKTVHMNNRFLVSAAVVVLSACSTPSATPLLTNEQAAEVMRASFKDKGIAKVERLQQTEAQKTCSEYATKKLPPELSAKLEAEALSTVNPPSDGKYLGNWKEGEKIAQNGRGLQFSDDEKTVNGGNCYACHQLQKAEIAYGNIGPSLQQYAKIRGGATEPIVKYTWAKIWNSHSFNACSNMPRFGAAGILTEQQIKDVMALLLDPESPVNK
jgi:sulfur-oxidizing protein SoxX